ncbi:MAG: S-layer protein [Planctomycetaceae bacterium]|nr:S-layer protein [Planctomycetaceae bacterium]
MCRNHAIFASLFLAFANSFSMAAEPVSFELQVQPIMAARGCSQGACHGKQRGQNGFQLSLLGFDSDFDYAALTKNARGRRVFPASPERSLLLHKATGQAPHGGGQRFAVESDEYRILYDWIDAGLPRSLPNEPTLTSVTAAPTEKFMKPGEKLQFAVTAHYSDGTTHDVTGMSMFQSNEGAIVSVNDKGMMEAGPIPGEASIMARFMNVIATCNVAIPLEGEVPNELYENLPRKNFIDDLVWQKLKSLGITPSEPVDDVKFMRRVYIDIIGTLPKPDEVREFLADSSDNKREALIDRLLDRPEYAEHWANKWADLLRPNPYRVGIKAVLNYDNWIRTSFRQDKPYDQFVRELVTAQGSTWHNGAATLFRDRRSPDEITTIVTQLFLGIRLECAKCHHHPFEKWTQDDFYGFAAYFARVGRKGTGLSPPISGGEEIVLTAKSGSVSHPLTGEKLDPKPLFGEAPAIADDQDPRDALAEWITSPENDYFTQVMVNRVWADLMGRGIVVPVDDLRATNPPSNGPLLNALGKDFRDKQFSLKQLLRTITTSYVYSLSSDPTERNVGDTRNYSRHYRQRLRAEVLMDAMSDITGVPDSFAGMPPGSRAKEIWTHRVTSLFLDTFGRPDPNQDPPCERQEDATVTQALHMMNALDLHNKVISDKARPAVLAGSEAAPDKIAEELYLLVYGRMPDDDERRFAVSLFGDGKDKKVRRQAAEDLLWALVNTPEFLFKD